MAVVWWVERNTHFSFHRIINGLQKLSEIDQIYHLEYSKRDVFTYNKITSRDN